MTPMIIQQFIRFAWVGVLGFIVNGGVVAWLSPVSGPLWAQVVGFPLAVTVTWWLNRHFTFSPSRHSLKREWAYYVSANIIGWLVNNGSYVLLVTQSSWFHHYPVAAVAIGSVAGMVFNFSLSRRFVFSHAFTTVKQDGGNPPVVDFSRISPRLLLILWPLILKAPLWSGWLISDPLVIYGGLATGVSGQVLPGAPTIDPNIAYTSDALGRRAARDWLAGTVPWWNPFEGTGTPLVAEMQSAALFLPFVLWYALPDGQLWFHLCLQIVAGLGTWLLLRRLGLGRPAALSGALLFQINGSYAWLANAVVNPIAFLPWWLLGVEEAVRAVRSGTGHGWLWIPAALAFSLYAGFPEVAYINGLLAAVWSLVRLVRLQRGERWRFLALVGVGGLGGLLLALPVVVPFFEYLGVAEIGGHEHGFGTAFLPRSGMAAVFFPYLFGPVFSAADAEISVWWGNVGGFFGVGLTVLALLSLTRRREWELKAAIFLWIALGLGKTFGLPGVSEGMNLLPLLEQAAFYRYVWPSLSLGLVVLAGFALDDLARRPMERGKLLWVTIGGLLMLALAAWLASEALQRLMVDGRLVPVMGGSILLAGAVMGGVVGAVWAGRAWTAKVIAAVIVMEAAIYFLVPVLAYPARGELHLGGVDCLSGRLGLQRFYTTGPLAPNYGSAFGIAQLNYNDLPVPKKLVSYIHARLDPYADSISFVGGYHPDPGSPRPLRSLQDHLRSFARAGVSHVVTRPGERLYSREYEYPVIRHHNVAMALGAGEGVEVRLSSLPPGNLHGLGVFIGTSHGRAEGMFEVRLCQDQRCVTAAGSVRRTKDNDYFDFQFPDPVTIAAGRPVEIELNYSKATRPLALWLWPQDLGFPQRLTGGKGVIEGKGLRLRFGYWEDNNPHMSVVHRDAVMSIVRLNGFRPYFSAAGCRLNVKNRSELEADCESSSQLVRLETHYPGWRARVNGISVPVQETEALFQQIDLPAGRSRVQFQYRPGHYGWIMAGFAGGWAVLLAGVWWRRSAFFSHSTRRGSPC